MYPHPYPYSISAPVCQSWVLEWQEWYLELDKCSEDADNLRGDLLAQGVKAVGLRV